MEVKRQLAIISCICIGITTLSVPASDFSLGARVGTLGFGVDASKPLAKQLNARIALNLFSYDTDETKDGINYNIDLQLQSLAALLDWHPMENGFRVTAGVLANSNEVDLSAAGVDNYEIGNEIYQGNLRVDGLLEFREMAPYLGVGWGSAPTSKPGWSVAADIGVLFQGEPQVSLTANGTATRLSDGRVLDVSTDTQFQQDIVDETRNLQDDVDEFEFYPVLSVGVMYRF